MSSLIVRHIMSTSYRDRSYHWYTIFEDEQKIADLLCTKDVWSVQWRRFLPGTWNDPAHMEIRSSSLVDRNGFESREQAAEYVDEQWDQFQNLCQGVLT